MKKKKVYLILMALAMGCAPKSQHFSYNEGINIIPVPVELAQRQGDGSFRLTANTVIVAKGEESTSATNYLWAKIKASTGYDLAIIENAPSNNYIAVSINEELEGIDPEGYTLQSSAEGVVIEGVDVAGAFYGVQSLLQLLPAQIESEQRVEDVRWEVPAVKIRDYPRFEYRGFMLDVCRHYMEVESIKRQLDVLSMFKINRFHWHLTDDQGWRIEIKKYPKLTEVGAVRTEGDGSTYGPYFYTQEQIREVVEYAAQRHITVVPEIELPGHSLAAIAAYPELSCSGQSVEPRNYWGVEQNILCVGSDSVFEFLEGVIDEIVELFPSQLIHIGGDEAPKSMWKACPQCQARVEEMELKASRDEYGAWHSVEDKLQSYFIDRVGRYVESKGREFIGWDEILQGGLAKGAKVMSWQSTDGGVAAAKMGHEVVMTPASEGLYLDHYQGAKEVEETTIGGYAPWTKTYGYEPISDDFTSPQMEELVLGVQGNMWTEYRLSDSSVEYMTYPRMLAVAEIGWSPRSAKDEEYFAKRLLNAYARLDYHGVNYHIPMAEGVLSRNIVYTGDSTVVEFSNTADTLPMVYTLGGEKELTASSTPYTNPIVITDSSTVIHIATVLPTGRLSVVRSIPVERQELSPAVIPQRDDEARELARRVRPRRGQTIKVRRAPGLFAHEIEFANARFDNYTLVSTFAIEPSSNDNLSPENFEPSLSVYEGYINVPESGVYTFATDMSKLIIDGKEIINNTKKLSRHSSHQAQIALEAGKHTYMLYVNNMIKDGWPVEWGDVGFKYSPPSEDELQDVTSKIIGY